MSTGDRLRRISDIIGGVSALGEALNVKPQTFYDYFRGKTKPGKRLKERLEGLGFSPEWIDYGHGSIYADNEAGKKLYEKFGSVEGEGLWNHAPGEKEPHREPTPHLGANIREFYGSVPSRAGRMIPVHSAVLQAGAQQVAMGDYIKTMFDVDKMFSENTSFVEAAGDSMREVGIEDGDLLLVSSTEKPRAHDIVVARIGAAMMLKRILEVGEQPTLYPDNPDSEPISVTPKMGFSVVGVVVQILKNPRRKRG